MSRLVRAQETCAFLIGSGKYEPRGEADDDQGTGKATKKAGIKQKLTKSGRQIQDGEWALGDIKNMENLMERLGIEECDSHNYIEHRKEDGTYGLGKAEILQMIGNFFKKDKTYFILYYTGHARRDGAWCFPRTKKRMDAGGSGVVPNIGETQAAQTVVATVELEVSTEGGAKEPETSVVQDGAEKEKSRTPSPVPKPEHLPQDQDAISRASLSSHVSGYSIIQSAKEQPDRAKLVNDFLSFHEVIGCWDDINKTSHRERYLMIILDCCHAGKWVEMVNELTVKADRREEGDLAADAEQIQPHKRHDICIQAACRPVEPSMVASSQLSSIFTRAFVAAQSKSFVEKMILAFIDHAFVLQVVSFATHSGYHDQFTPISSVCTPFGGIKFFNSFDDMYLSIS